LPIPRDTWHMSHNKNGESNCSVTRLSEDWLATSWPRRGSKYSDFVLKWLLKLNFWKLLIQ